MNSKRGVNMHNQALVIAISCVMLALGCSSSRNKNPDGAIGVRAVEMTQKRLPVKYENQKISFQALFEEIVSNRDWEGLEQYKNTYFLISAMTRDKKKRLIDILVPAHEQTLVELRFGDLFTVTGVVGSRGEDFYIVADDIKKNVARR